MPIVQVHKEAKPSLPSNLSMTESTNMMPIVKGNAIEVLLNIAIEVLNIETVQPTKLLPEPNSQT